MKRATLLGLMLAFGAMASAQNNVPEILGKEKKGSTTLDVLSKCDVPLSKMVQPDDGFFLLTSTRQFGWNGAPVDLELAQQIHYPKLAPSGQVIEYIALKGAANGAAVGKPGEISVWTDVGGSPGALLATDLVDCADNIVYSTSEAFNAPLTPGQDLWISYVYISDPLGNPGPRWFWGQTDRLTNLANGHPPFHVTFVDAGSPRFGPDCPQWTNYVYCDLYDFLRLVFIGNTAGLNYEFNICRNAKLNIGTGVPTMTQWGLFIFGLVILTLGVVALYNYQTKSRQVPTA